MLYQFLFSDGLTGEQAVAIFLISIFVFFISLTVHELAHGFAAYKMGDLTAKIDGRLSLNPLKHLDMSGFLAFMLIGVGWAKPVPVNPLNFKKYKTGMRWVSISGILANFLLGLLAAIIYAVLLSTVGFAGTIMQYVELLLIYFMMVNSMLALFNLLPFMPLDGFNFISTFLKPDNKFIQWNARKGITTVFTLIIACLFIEILTGFDFFGYYLRLIHNFIYIPIALLGV